MNKFDQEAASITARDSLFVLESTKLQPDNLFIGDKVLIYAHADNNNVYEQFWWVHASIVTDVLEKTFTYR